MPPNTEEWPKTDLFPDRPLTDDDVRTVSKVLNEEIDGEVTILPSCKRPANIMTTGGHQYRGDILNLWIETPEFYRRYTYVPGGRRWCKAPEKVQKDGEYVQFHEDTISEDFEPVEMEPDSETQ